MIEIQNAYRFYTILSRQFNCQAIVGRELSLSLCVLIIDLSKRVNSCGTLP